MSALSGIFGRNQDSQVKAFEKKGDVKRNQTIVMDNWKDCNTFTFDSNERNKLTQKYKLKNS